jgi:hypothetical protein
MSRAQLTSTDQQNSGGPVAPFLAGKNKIINGDFGIWQRGTNSGSVSAGGYLACDRFFINGGFGSFTGTLSRQTFTPGTAPVAGYEGQYFARFAVTAASATGLFGPQLSQPIENVQTFAGQTITVSFWGKASATLAGMTVAVAQNFGSGGSAGLDSNFGSFTFTTSWQRFSVTFAVPSISGKTVGTSSFLGIGIAMPVNTTGTFDVWGVQVEAGSVATPFTTATGTLQGELAACQRYYWRATTLGGSAYALFTRQTAANSSTVCACYPVAPVSMRIQPTSVEYSNLGLTPYGGTGVFSVTSLTIASDSSSTNILSVLAGSSGLTTGVTYNLIGYASTSAYLGFNAEL